MNILDSIAARLSPWRRKLLAMFVVILVVGVPLTVAADAMFRDGGLRDASFVAVILLLTSSFGLFALSYLYDETTGILGIHAIRNSRGTAKATAYLWRYLALVALIAWFSLPAAAYRILTGP